MLFGFGFGNYGVGLYAPISELPGFSVPERPQGFEILRPQGFVTPKRKPGFDT